MEKAVIKHSLLEDPFNIPMKIRKKLPIEKNIFELCEPQLKRISTPQLPRQQQCHMSDPLIMDSALIKSLLFGKMQSYLILMSLIISCLLVYEYEQHKTIQNQHNGDGKFNGNGYQTQRVLQQQQYYSQSLQDLESMEAILLAKKYLLLLETLMSIFLVAITIIGHWYHNEANKARGLQTKYFGKIIKLLTFILHPNIWIQDVNFLFHLVIILRLPFLVSYWIKTSVYHNNRSFRLTEIYGIKPSQNFFFAIKSIVDQMLIQQIVLVYVFIAFLFSHCLYLAGMSELNEGKSFWSCFQIIIVTLPTIGYGEYEVINLMQRGIILLALIVGACMNSLITLIMLKQFQMSTQQTFSYNLLRKLNLKERMEHISRQYIVSTVQQLRSNNFNALKNSRDERRQIDNNFKQEYKFLKTRYTQINTRDLNSMFNLFKQQLKQFRIHFQQMNNLIFVLLAKLNKIKPSYKKKQRKLNFFKQIK